uniref:Uncharacterized protein n=1 Tax=Bicosoecida sp. CB-2014 TaxID=1486930 RepID=A0A7S1G6I4_9STRA
MATAMATVDGNTLAAKRRRVEAETPETGSDAFDADDAHTVASDGDLPAATSAAAAATVPSSSAPASAPTTSAGGDDLALWGVELPSGGSLGDQTDLLQLQVDAGAADLAVTTVATSSAPSMVVDATTPTTSFDAVAASAALGIGNWAGGQGGAGALQASHAPAVPAPTPAPAASTPSAGLRTIAALHADASVALGATAADAALRAAINATAGGR